MWRAKKPTISTANAYAYILDSLRFLPAVHVPKEIQQFLGFRIFYELIDGGFSCRVKRIILLLCDLVRSEVKSILLVNIFEDLENFQCCC